MPPVHSAFDAHLRLSITEKDTATQLQQRDSHGLVHSGCYNTVPEMVTIAELIKACEVG
jgi:hypothetical protein